MIEGASWRPHAFRRFQIGRLPDGREEWLEFWRQNHLLSPFAELSARREEGPYGGRSVAFLGLSDLIRSKETERKSDWQDVELLEEIHDLRLLARATDTAEVITALAHLRSRRGFLQALALGHLADSGGARSAFDQATNPITRAYLVPYLPPRVEVRPEPGMIGEILTGPLRKSAPASARHLALVEAVRNLYVRAAREADRADKATIRQNL